MRPIDTPDPLDAGSRVGDGRGRVVYVIMHA